MKSSGMILLFSEPKQLTQDPYSFLFSALGHCGVVGLISAGVIYAPRLNAPSLLPHYPMRRLELHMPNPRIMPDEATINVPTPLHLESKPDADRLKPEPADIARPIMHQPQTSEIQEATADQTLMQLNVPPKLLLLQKLPLPAVLIRSSDTISDHSIVPPSPQKYTSAAVKPIIQLPNQERDLSALNIASADLPKDALQILPSATSPVVIRGPQSAKQLPQSESISVQPSHGTLISVSDLRLADGKIPLPRVNEIGPMAQQVHSEGSGGSNNGHRSGNIGTGSGSQPSTKRIVPPKNGKFTMVLIGNSLEEQYPETAGMWNGRLAYSVYLHVGTAKSWILQFSKPRSSEAAATGSTAHLEAPWPTDMVVPAFAPGDINADAVLVHGLLNKAGHFENLSVAFPAQFSLAKFLLDTLQKWQFRAAEEGGHATTVEVLLIIPETVE